MRILVTGVGRSGNTWVATTLGTAPSVGVLREPDTVDVNPFAMKALAGLGDNPVVSPGSAGPPGLTRLWDVALGGSLRYVRGQQRCAQWLFEREPVSRRKAVMHPGASRPTLPLRVAGALAVPWQSRGVEHHVVKSIRLAFALEWVVDRWNPAVVLCRRHPLDVVASQLELGHEWMIESLAPMGARARARERYGVAEPAAGDRLQGLAWRVGLLMSALDETRGAHPEFHVVDHEVLCRDPLREFRRLVRAVGLEWTSAIEAHVMASNRPGTGYELDRVAGQQAGKWRGRLSGEQALVAARVIERFPIAARYDLGVDV